MTETKEKMTKASKQAKARGQRVPIAPPYRTILIALSVGVLIGLRFRR